MLKYFIVSNILYLLIFCFVTAVLLSLRVFSEVRVY